MSDRSDTSPAPRVERPDIPAEYGVSRTTERVDWAHVEDRLGAARVYWIATVGAGGRPRVRPVDGMYVDGTLYVGGTRRRGGSRSLPPIPTSPSTLTAPTMSSSSMATRRSWRASATSSPHVSRRRPRRSIRSTG